VRKYGALLGRQIRLFNRRYLELQRETPYFNAQHFLWPHRELEAHVLERFGPRGEEILADLRATGRKLMRTIFSDRPEAARRQIYLMFRRDVRRVLRLRLSYDPEFVAGRLPQSLVADVTSWEQQFRVRVMSRRRVAELQAQARARWGEVDALLAGCCSDLALTPEQVRAVRMAYHVDYGALRTQVRGEPGCPVESRRRRWRCRRPSRLPMAPIRFGAACGASLKLGHVPLPIWCRCGPSTCWPSWSCRRTGSWWNR
jgi:hypothetical protein